MIPWAKFFLLLSVIAGFSTVAFCADIESIRQRFEADFISGYEDGKCGENINGFLSRLRRSGVDLGCVVSFLADGGGDVSVFYARNLRGSPERRTWFHHYFAVIPTHAQCSRERYRPRETDLVLDFDYGNQPVLTPLRIYLETMWVTKRLHRNPEALRTDFSVGITSFQVVDALRALRADSPDARRQSVAIEKIKLRDLYLSLL